MKICPNTNEECVNYAGCNHIGACNKPIPVKEFAAKSPENAEIIAEIVEGLNDGTITFS